MRNRLKNRLILIAAALATTVTLSACWDGGPFNPYGHTPLDECHPEKWLDTAARSWLPEARRDSLAEYQRRCKAAREALNGR